MANLKKQYIHIFYLSILGVFFFSSCSNTEQKSIVDPIEKIADAQVKDLLKKVFQSNGGLNNWTAKKSIQFKKYFALFDSLGTTEMSVNQIHQYNYAHGEEINIQWKKENKNHLLKSENGTISKTINDQPDTLANPISLKNTVLSSTFVVNIPFNLLDEGIVFDYIGIDTLEGGEVVEVLQADFDPNKYNNHSTKDTWWFYFDQNNYHLLGYMVKHADHVSYVKNLTFTEVKGFTFPLKRKSWRVNSNREKLYLRAEYEYSDYKIEL